MSDNGIKRQFKAIFSADVKGYSKLMGDDDEATVNTITAYREIIAACIEKHLGRVVDSPGDNLLNTTHNHCTQPHYVKPTLRAPNGSSF